MNALSAEALLPRSAGQRAGRHYGTHGQALKCFRLDVQREFVFEAGRMCRQLAGQRLQSQGSLIAAALHDYVSWLGWCVWCSAHLAPPLGLTRSADARRVAAAMLVYCGPRIVDDAIDDHRTYKGIHATLLDRLLRARPDLTPAGVRASVALVGSWVLLYGLQRLRRHGDGDAAHQTSRLCERIASGAILENLHASPLSWDEYREIVQLKAVAYDQILYRNLVAPAPEPLKSDLLEISARLSALAQHLNDFHDLRRDLEAGQRNSIEWFPSTDEFLRFLQSEAASVLAALERVPESVGDAFAAALIDTIESVARMDARTERTTGE